MMAIFSRNSPRFKGFPWRQWAVAAWLEAWLHQWLSWTVLFFGAGALWEVSDWGGLPTHYVVLCMVLSVLAGMMWRGQLAVVMVALAIFCMSTGIWHMQQRIEQLYTPMLKEKITKVRLTGRLEKILPDARGMRLVIAQPHWEGATVQPRRVRVRARGVAEGVSVGDEIGMIATLFTPSPPVMPDGFNLARHSYVKGIGAVGYATSGVWMEADAPQKAEPYLLQLRGAMQQYWDQFNGDAAGLGRALTLGQRGHMGEPAQQAMRDAGLAHLMAISGLHLGLLAGVVFLLVRRSLACWPYAALHWPLKQVAAVIALAMCALYVALAGAPVSAQRALVMVALVLLAMLVQRPSQALRLLAIAGWGLLLFRPEYVLSAGFQLSFAATAGLAAWYQWHGQHERAHMPHNLSFWWRMPFAVGRGLRLSLITTIIALTVTAPITAWHFQHMGLAGLVGNVFAIPLTGWAIMPSLLMGSFLLPWPPLASWWGEYVSVPLLDVLLHGAAWVAAHGQAVAQANALPVWATVLAVGLVFLLLRWRAGVWWQLALLAALVVWSVWPAQRPDMILGEDNILLHDDALGWVMAGDGNAGWVEGQWLRRYRVEDYVHAAPYGENDGLPCDAAGCVFVVKGQQVEWLWRMDADASATFCPKHMRLWRGAPNLAMSQCAHWVNVSDGLAPAAFVWRDGQWQWWQGKAVNDGRLWQ